MLFCCFCLFVLKGMDFKIYVCTLKYGRFLRGFVCLFFTLCSLNKTEKLKAGGGVVAAVMSFKDLRGKEK